MKAVTSIALFIASAALMPAQAPVSEKRPEFEVASVRPAKQDNSHKVQGDRDSFRAHNITLKRLIALAYYIDIGEDLGEVLGGPKWAYSDGFDINAKIPDEFAHGLPREKLGQMLQNLLAARFQLVIHREQRRESGYLLLVSKNGPKMERANADERSNLDSRNTRATAKNITMKELARYLSDNIQIPVMDKSGLTGGFDFQLDWVPERLDARPEASSDPRPSIFSALQEQLGLKLESAQVRMLAIVIDRAEKPGHN